MPILKKAQTPRVSTHCGSKGELVQFRKVKKNQQKVNKDFEQILYLKGKNKRGERNP